jgi:hypothetical protein
MTLLATEQKRMAKRKRSKSKGQVLSLLDRLPGGLPVVVCSPEPWPTGEALKTATFTTLVRLGTKHRCDKWIDSGQVFLEWQPPRQAPGDWRARGGDFTFYLGHNDPDLTGPDYDYLWDLVNQDYAMDLQAMYADRIVRLSEVPLRHRATVHQRFTTLHRNMLRRQQDVLDSLSERGPNWDAWHQRRVAEEALDTRSIKERYGSRCPNLWPGP